uniref:Uncharacterized protein n=1 Tax=Glossina brevipalpis TaxID=37001 RepID=A0A1A9WF59_9MUSC
MDHTNNNPQSQLEAEAEPRRQHPSDVGRGSLNHLATDGNLLPLPAYPIFPRAPGSYSVVSPQGNGPPELNLPLEPDPDHLKPRNL